MIKYFFIALLFTMFSLNSYAQFDSQFGYEQNKIVVKIKSSYNLSQGIINSVNSYENTSQIGIKSIDKVANQYKLKDISQVFPHHSDPAFQSMIKENTEEDVNALDNIFYYEFKENIPVSQLCKDLQRLPEVEYAEPLYRRNFTDVPNDEYYEQLYHLPQIFGEEAWDIAKGEEGAEVIIGICDSGTDWFHPDLIDNLKTNLGEDLDGDGKVIQFNEDTQQWEFDPDDINGIDDDGNGYPDDFVGWNFAYMSDDTPPNDPRGSVSNDHGTHVAGLAAGVTDNETGISAISWNVKFLPTKHSDNSSGRVLTHAFEGIVYLAENGADIINMSWGGPGYSLFERDVIEYANSLGVILVSSAGNSNNEDITYPPAFPGVISVASVAFDDSKASYSSYGPFVDISAPGGDSDNGAALLSTLPNNEYGLMQGTSMASPVAAGMFALVKSYFPNYSKDEIISKVLGTTDDISELNPDYDYKLGTGRINALKALTEEPIIEEGLILSTVNYVAGYEDEDGTIYESPNLYAGGEFMLKVTTFNSNNFYGIENLTATLTSDNEDINIISDTYQTPIEADSYEDLYFNLEVTNEETSSIAEFQLQFSTTDGEILFGETVEFEMLIDNGGILVWQPVLGEGSDIFGSYNDEESDYPGSNHPEYSGGYIYNYLKTRGHNVIITDKLLPDISNFDAIYASVGNVYMPGLSEWGEKTLMMLMQINDYLQTRGPEAKLFMESNNFFSHVNFAQFGIDFNPIIFGLTDINYYENSIIDVENVRGPEGSLLVDVLFEESEQQYNMELDYLVPHPQMAYPFLEIEDFGTVMTFATNPFGNTIFYSSVTLGQLVDESCPSTRENILRVIINFFGIMAPMNIALEDVETCKNNPISIGADDTECGRLRPISNAVTGGSGAFVYEWTPTYGLDDANSMNPVLLNPVIDRTYTVTATDIFTGETATKNIKVDVKEGAKVKVPLLVFHTINSPINLNDKIISIEGGTEPYVDYIWTKNNERINDPENEIPTEVISRYYLQVVDSDGCPSKTVRMIVYSGMFKEFNEDDFEISAGGSLLLTSYPNPASDKINVLSVFENTTNAEVSIIDMSGKEVLSFTKNSVSEIDEELDISNLSGGSYIIVVETDNDRISKKFVKQ
jgi:subtilisin family serine protease